MENSGFQQKFEILPEPVEKLLRAGHHVGEFLLKQLMHIQHAPDRHSNHYRGADSPKYDDYEESKGASAQLDRELYDKTDKNNGWCDMGTYWEG